MKILPIYLAILLIAISAVSCGDDEQTDFRDDFIGIYDCPKGSTVIELEVTKDPDNENNIIIGPYSVPMDESGSYGPENIVDDVILQVSFDGNEITYREEAIFVLGQISVCTLTGIRR